MKILDFSLYCAGRRKEKVREKKGKKRKTPLQASRIRLCVESDGKKVGKFVKRIGFSQAFT
ncbi:MAG: hypothetical protein ACI39E_01125 [Acutalibacteraceae bacterium]